MNNQSTQQNTNSASHPAHLPCPCHDTPNCPEHATVEINASQLERIAELLHILDEFLRHPNTCNQLADYLHATGQDRPQPDGTSYDTNLIIDQLSFTAHNLRAHRRKPLE